MPIVSFTIEVEDPDEEMTKAEAKLLLSRMEDLAASQSYAICDTSFDLDAYGENESEREREGNEDVE